MTRKKDLVEPVVELAPVEVTWNSAQVAKHLGLTPKTIQRAGNMGVLPYRISQSGLGKSVRRRYTQEDVDVYVEWRKGQSVSPEVQG